MGPQSATSHFNVLESGTLGNTTSLFIYIFRLGFGYFDFYFFHVHFHSIAGKLFLCLEICAENCTTMSEIFPMNVLKHYNLAAPVTLKEEQVSIVIKRAEGKHKHLLTNNTCS